MRLIAVDQKPREIGELERAKSEMDYFRRIGNGFGYKQAKRHYEKLLRKAKRKL